MLKPLTLVFNLAGGAIGDTIGWRDFADTEL